MANANVDQQIKIAEQADPGAEYRIEVDDTPEPNKRPLKPQLLEAESMTDHPEPGTDFAREHAHTNLDGSRPINIFYLIGMIETVDAVPVGIPKTFYGQFKIYKNGATKRLYYYDSFNKEWDYLVGV